MSFSPVRSPSSSSQRSRSRDRDLGGLGERISSRVRSATSGPSSAGGSYHAQLRERINRDVFEPRGSAGAGLDLSGAGRPPPVIRPTTPLSPTGPAPTSGPSGRLDTTGDNAQVDGWISQAEQQLGRDFTPAEEEAIRIIAYHESRNDPSASNNFDANAQAGDPSQGLMQVTQSNFRRYNPGGDIFNPVDSIIAAVRYADERYGGIDKAKGVVDLQNGGQPDPYGGWNGGYTWY